MRLSGWLANSSRRFAVHFGRQFFAGLESDGFARGDFNCGPGLGIAALARLLFAGDEIAKPAEVDFFTFSEGVGDLGEEGVNHRLGVFLCVPC